eukprot:4571520-Prymnesium_polylepis.3
MSVKGLDAAQQLLVVAAVDEDLRIHLHALRKDGQRPGRELLLLRLRLLAILGGSGSARRHLRREGFGVSGEQDGRVHGDVDAREGGGCRGTCEGAWRATPPNAGRASWWRAPSGGARCLALRAATAESSGATCTHRLEFKYPAGAARSSLLHGWSSHFVVEACVHAIGKLGPRNQL